MAVPSTVWADVVDQDTAVAALRAAARSPVHAYLFLGPPGSTKEVAARAFAATLLTEAEDASSRVARLVMAGEHIDVREVRRTGPAISAEQAREVIRLAALAPVEGRRKVMILHEFHLLQADAAARLLKIVEEPPASTTFIVLADLVPPELITISSRCVRITFRAIRNDVLAARLAADGIDPHVAAEVAAAAGGDLVRARVLAVDPTLAERRRAFADVPHRLDGTGATVIRLASDLLERIDEAAAPLVGRHAAELAELDARTSRTGERGAGRRTLEERQRREFRRHRMDELRGGLAVLAAGYRDALVAGTVERPDAAVDAVHRIHAAIESLERNPNEQLLIQALLWSLPAVGR